MRSLGQAGLLDVSPARPIAVTVWARAAEARARLERAVTASPALRLVAAPGVPLEEVLAGARSDVVLLDADEGAAHTLDAGAGPPVVALMSDPARVLRDRWPGRLRGALPRDASGAEIAAAIQAVGAGLVALHPRTLGRAVVGRRARAAVEALTPRELDVLAMLAEGLGNKAIADRLGISAHTAKFHVAAILGKLGAGSRTEAVTIGMRRGLVAI